MKIAIHRFSPLALAVTAWLSLSPYFLWGSTNGLLFGAVVAALVTLALLAAGARPRMGLETMGVALVSLFLVYITIEPKLDGDHTRWIFVLPTLGALSLLSDGQRQRCIRFFAGIFALTLIPSVLISIWVAIGLPFTFSERPHANAVMAAAGAKMLTTPVAMFIESNSLTLPWGGVLFRPLRYL